MTKTTCVTLGFFLLGALGFDVRASDLREGELTSKHVPGKVPYGVILPDGYDQSASSLPLLLLLHGGGGTHKDLEFWKPVFDELWRDTKLPPLVVAMASVGERAIERRARYMNFKDGSEKWESFVLKDFLAHLRREYSVAESRDKTLIAGISDGGFGALKMAFKHPEKFAAVVAFEPAILPALRWKNVAPRNHFFISSGLLARYFGSPIDEDYWAANNPATIARSNAKEIRQWGLDIFIECGDQDYLNLHEGTEFLHQILWNAEVWHEYRLVRGADHIGRSLPERMREGLEFFNQVLHPPGEDASEQLKAMKGLFRALKESAERESPQRIRSGEGQD